MPLAHFVVLVPHHRGAVDIGGHLPPESLVEQIILGGGRQVLAAPDHVGNAHQVVVDDVGEVVGGQAVGLEQHLIVQGAVFHGDVPKDRVGKGSLPAGGNFLANHVGYSGGQLLANLLLGQLPAVSVISPQAVRSVEGGQPLLITKTPVGVALLHQKPGISGIEVPALRLDIGSHRAPHVGTLVPVQTALTQCVINHLRRALHQALLVGVLNAQKKPASAVPGNEPGIQGGAQVAHVHIPRGGGGEAGAHAALGNPGLQLVKPFHIHPRKLLYFISPPYSIFLGKDCQEGLNMLL